MSVEEETMIAEGVFTVLNDKGLHTRPSTELVKCLAQFRSQVVLKYRELEVNGKSLLGILMMAAERGAKIGITARGEDANEVIQALLELAKNRFYIAY